jgi:serine/threonine protein kinase
MCPGCHETFGPQNAVAVSSDAITLRGILGDLKLEATKPAAKPKASEPPKNPFSAEFLKTFEMVGFLGKGAMGAVFLMRQVNLDRLVAVKAVRSSGMTEKENKRLLKEARVIARLNHPAIRAIHDVGVDHQVPYMVCEYVDGETLADTLKAHGPMPLTEALRAAMAILEGLEFAHKQGVVHRDLKPGNIMMTREGRPKIVDFGLATANAMSTVETLAGRILGTPRYMSPEQCEGNETTLASDVYAMGLVVYEMLTGRLPYDGPSPMNFMDQHIHAKPKTVTEVRPDLPGELDPIIDKALEKDPAKRHASAMQLSEQLLGVFSGLTAVRFTPTRPAWVKESAGGPEHGTATMQEGTSGVLGAASLGAGSTTWPSSPPAVSAGTMLSGRFEMVKPLRTTETGELWLAKDSALEGEQVLVNLLHAALWSNAVAKAGLVKEAKAAIKLSHPNIERLVTLEPGPTPFFVVEWVEGPTLEADLARRAAEGQKVYTPEEALPLLEGIAEGLEYAHARGVVHGDLKPSNVILEPEADGPPFPRIGDFGTDAVVRTLSAGKPGHASAYRAPELSSGKAPDARADVYALGALLYHMLTLKLPVPPTDTSDPSWPGRVDLLPPREPLPPSVANVVLQALAREPEQRPATPGQLVDRFRGALRSGGQVQRKPGRATGMFRVADLKQVLPDKQQEAQKLTRVGLFQLVTDEVFKDGVVEDWENRTLVALTEFLELGTEQARGVAWKSLEKFQLGKLGSKRALDPRILYSKALYFAYVDGSLSQEEAWMLEGLRKLFGLTDKDHVLLLERVRTKM